LERDRIDYTAMDLDGHWNAEPSPAEVFDGSDAAIYTTNADGWLTYYNEAASNLWGYRPDLGRARWCGSWRIFTPEGDPLPLDRCPMAVALKEGRAVRGVHAVLERPDGSLVPFEPYPTPLRDASGSVIAGSNVLVPLSPRSASRPTGWSAAAAPGSVLEEEPYLTEDDLVGRLQSLLAAIADVEISFEVDCERLRDWSGPASNKQHLIDQLELRRQRQHRILGERLLRLRRRTVALTRHDVGGANGSEVGVVDIRRSGRRSKQH